MQIEEQTLEESHGKHTTILLMERHQAVAKFIAIKNRLFSLLGISILLLLRQRRIGKRKRCFLKIWFEKPFYSRMQKKLRCISADVLKVTKTRINIFPKIKVFRKLIIIKKNTFITRQSSCPKAKISKGHPPNAVHSQPPLPPDIQKTILLTKNILCAPSSGVIGTLPTVISSPVGREKEFPPGVSVAFVAVSPQEIV